MKSIEEKAREYVGDISIIDMPWGDGFVALDFGDGEHRCDRCKHSWWENENKPIHNWVLDNPVLFPKPIPVKGKLSFWDYPNIHSEPDEDGIQTCMCNIPVDEEMQVMNLIDDFRCKYCGGKWYK